MISVILYLGAKTLVMAGLLARPPLAGVVPAAIQPIWGWVAALLVSVAAGVIAWLDARRSDRPYLARTLLIFVISDSMLTLLIYGPTFYGE